MKLGSPTRSLRDFRLTSLIRDRRCRLFPQLIVREPQWLRDKRESVCQLRWVCATVSVHSGSPEIDHAQRDRCVVPNAATRTSPTDRSRQAGSRGRRWRTPGRGRPRPLRSISWRYASIPCVCCSPLRRGRAVAGPRGQFRIPRKNASICVHSCGVDKHS